MSKKVIYTWFITASVIFMLFHGINEFYGNKISRLNKELLLKMEKLQKVSRIYDEIKNNPNQNLTDLSLMVFLQDVTAKLHISENVVFLKPKTSDNQREMASMRIEKLSLDNIIAFLRELDKYSNINISQLSVTKRFDEPELADLNVDVSKL